jgi:hypothetical protein
VVQLNAHIAFLFQQLLLVGGKGITKQLQALGQRRRILLPLSFLLRTNLVDHFLSHAAVGGPLAAHQANQAAFADFYDVAAGDLLGFTVGVVHHQRSDAAPTRLLAAEEVASRHFAHQVRHDVVDELPLSV